MNLRTSAAWAFSSLSSFIFLAIASGLISANVQKLADKLGWDNFLVHWSAKLRWELLRGLWWFWSIFGLSGGVALTLWLTPLIVSSSNPSVSSATGAGANQIVALQPQVATPGQQLSTAVQTSPQSPTKTGIDLNQYSRKTCFDYSTNDGIVKVGLNAINFEIHFGKRNTDSIYVYKDSTNLRAIADLGEINPGEDINFAAFDSSSRAYTILLGGYFIAQNLDGYFLLARILSIKDNTRGDANDEVCFAYSIDASKSGRFKAF